MTSMSMIPIQSPESLQFKWYQSDSQQPRLNVFLCFCYRSSDSDGAFETPESTTPVKAVSPTESQTQQLASDDTGTESKLCHDVGLHSAIICYTSMIKESCIAPSSGKEQYYLSGFLCWDKCLCPKLRLLGYLGKADQFSLSHSCGYFL